jgi:hypothetical protein
VYEAFTCFTGTKVQILTQKATELAKEVKKTQKSGHYETWHLKGILAEGACLHKVLTLLTLLVQKQEGTDCGWLLKPATDFTYFTGTKVGRY